MAPRPVFLFAPPRELPSTSRLFFLMSPGKPPILKHIFRQVYRVMIFMGFLKSAASALLLFSLTFSAANAADGIKTLKSHVLSLAGTLQYVPDFSHLEVVDSKAAKGGTLSP